MQIQNREQKSVFSHVLGNSSVRNKEAVRGSYGVNGYFIEQLYEGFIVV